MTYLNQTETEVLGGIVAQLQLLARAHRQDDDLYGSLAMAAAHVDAIKIEF